MPLNLRSKLLNTLGLVNTAPPVSPTCGRYPARAILVFCFVRLTAWLSICSSGRFCKSQYPGVPSAVTVYGAASEAFVSSVNSLSSLMPHSWHSSIRASDRPFSTFVLVISASFSATSTFRPSARVATPSRIITCTSLFSFFTNSRKLSANSFLCVSETTSQ